MRILSNLSVSGLLGLNSVADANTDTDKFLVLDSSGIVRYRTGSELYSDIGAGVAAYTSVLQHTVKAGVALTKGQAVYVTSADGTNMIVGKASNASEATSSKTLGLVVQNLALNAQGFVITEGLLAGLDTSTAVAGDPVWLGTDGNLLFGLANKPYAPAHLVFIGIVTRVQQNNGEIFVKVQNGFELQELHNVQITSTPSDNTVLAYEASTSLYKMKSIPTLLGYTPADAARTLTINGTTYDLSENRTWNVGTVTGTGTSNYLAKWQSGSAIGNSLLYDTSAAVLIGTQTAGSGKFMVYSTSPDNHYQAIGTAPSFRFADTIVSPTYTGIFGLATATNHFIIGASAGDMVLANNTNSAGSFIFGTGATERMRISPTGNVSINNTNNTYRFDVNGTVRFTGQLRLESTITNGTYTYTLPSATGTIALTSDLTGGTVTSVGLSSATSGVTIGSTPITTSGTITLAIATASGSQQGLLSSTDWTTFNNKQNALTNPVTGTGTTNYLPKFTGTSTIGNSATQTDSTGNLMVGSANSGNAGTINVSVGVAGTTAGGLQLWAASNQTHFIQFGDGTTGAQVYAGYMAYAHSTDSLLFGTNGADKMTLNASGNLGLGVTPSAWAVYRAFQLGTGIAVGGLIGRTDGVNEINFGLNWTYTGGASLTYIASSFATNYYQKEGAHIWQTAPSGTAGNAISFTQAMTLNASGNLSVGNTNDTYKLDVSGTGRFTSNLYTSTALYINTTAAYGFRINSEGNNGFYNRGGSTAAHYPFLLENSSGALLFQVQGTGVATFGSSGGSGLRVYGGSGTNQWDVYLNSTNLRFSDNTGTGSVVFDRPISGTSANFSGTVLTTDGFQGRYFRIFEASAQRGGFYTYNVISGAGTDYSVGLFSESTLWFAAGGGITKHLQIASTGAATFSSSVTAGGFFASGSSNFARFTSTGTSDWGTVIVGSSGGARTTLLVGQSGYSNGFTVEYTGSAMQYLFRDGNVGIGTTSPTSYASNTLQVNGATSASIKITNTTSGVGNTDGLDLLQSTTDSYIWNRTNGMMSFATNNTERMRITSGGNVGIGTTSPSSGISSTETTLQIQNGNVAALALNNSASRKYTIYSGVGGQLGFYDVTGGAERITLSSSGNVGIGTTSPAQALTVSRGSSSAYIQLIGQSSNLYLGQDSAGAAIISDRDAPMYFQVNGSERMRITSGGSVGIGTTSPSYLLDVNGIGRFSGGYQTPVAIFERNADYGQVITLGRKGVGADAGIGYPADSTLGFYTASTERMRITSGGDVLVNATATTQGAKFYVNGIGAFGSVYVGALGTGTVYSNAGFLTNTNPSDFRLKNTIKPLTYGLNEILQLNPKSFYYNDNATNLKYGFIAQEVKEVMPELARKLDDKSDYLGLETEGIFVTLVNAVKELKAELDLIKNK